MSNAILNAAWSATCQSPAAKLVLVRLADRANEKGICWPSIKGLAKDCGLSERHLPRAITSNENDGHITVKRTKRTSEYHVHPCHSVTPDTTAPLTPCPMTPDTVAPRPLTPCPMTPDTMAPKPSVTQSEPSVNPKGADAPVGFEIPARLNSANFRSEWEAWLKYRKGKRGVSNWPVFFQRQLDELASLPPHEAAACLKESMLNGWTGIFPEKHRAKAAVTAAPLPKHIHGSIKL